MKKNEIEIKVELTEREFTGLVGPAAHFITEVTYGFFKPDFANVKEGVFPRIKHLSESTQPVVLTVKRKLTDNKDYFEREETEIKLDSAEHLSDLRDIIKNLGYSTEIIFEKRRYEKVLADMVISFDQLPFGFFVELEGEPETINKYAAELKISDKPRITKSYLALWDDYKKAHSITESNCVFEKNVNR